MCRITLYFGTYISSSATYSPTSCATIGIAYRVVRDRVEESVRDLALTELSLSVGAAVTVFSELVPLLQWGSLGCDRGPDQVRCGSFVCTIILSSYRRIVI